MSHGGKSSDRLKADEEGYEEGSEIMSTLEALIQAGQALPFHERQKLIEALRLENSTDDQAARHEAIRQVRGSMKGLLPSVDEFLAEKQSAGKGSQ